MTLDELISQCVQTINQPDQILAGIKPTVVIKMPATKHEPKKRRLAHGKAPMGTVVNRETDYDYVIFSAIDVLAYATVHKSIQDKKESK